MNDPYLTDGADDGARASREADNERYLAGNRAMVDGWLAEWADRQRRAISELPLGFVPTCPGLRPAEVA